VVAINSRLLSTFPHFGTQTSDPGTPGPWPACRKVYYSISAAIHSRIVRVRSRKNRRNREPPKFIRGGAAGGARGGYQRPGGQQQ